MNIHLNQSGTDKTDEKVDKVKKKTKKDDYDSGFGDLGQFEDVKVEQNEANFEFDTGFDHGFGQLYEKEA